LRDRGHDALLLFDHFMMSMAERLERKVSPLTDEETRFLLTYAWPGNVRELKHLAERRALGLDWRLDTDQQDDLTVETSSLADLVDQFELEVIERALDGAGGKASLAAERLQLPHRTLNEKLKRLSMKKSGYRA
jgi:two-component system C4-dicarboxylate transport response regulator DctD